MHPDVEIVDAPQALARVIANIAATRYAAGIRPDPASLDANYVRRSEAELQFPIASANFRRLRFVLP